MNDVFVILGINVYIVCIYMISRLSLYFCVCQFHNFVGIVFLLDSQFD